MESAEKKWYDYWLCSQKGIGGRTMERLFAACGTAQKIYEADEQLLKQILTPKQLEGVVNSRKSWQLREAYTRLSEQGICFVTREETDYPNRLRQIPDAPYGLFFRGRLPEEEEIAVAVVGARDCSEYGRYVATELGRYLGSRGVSVISGMARGIDGISQEAALKAGGMSFGVLGCGVDICYPAQNRNLYERLLCGGGILSIYPPGEPPKSWNFPSRNRIVSGLADAVVVIEAREKSGTLITVDMALEQGKEVYVVPGRVTDRLSDGCNRLLKQGAGVFLSPQDFLEEVTENFERKRPANSRDCLYLERHAATKAHADAECGLSSEWHLSPELDRVYQALDLYPRSIGEICACLPEESVSNVSGLLMRLCLEGAAVQASPGYFYAKALL